MGLRADLDSSYGIFDGEWMDHYTGIAILHPGGWWIRPDATDAAWTADTAVPELMWPPSPLAWGEQRFTLYHLMLHGY